MESEANENLENLKVNALKMTLFFACFFLSSLPIRFNVCRYKLHFASAISSRQAYSLLQLRFFSNQMLLRRIWKYPRFDRMRNQEQILGFIEKKDVEGTKPWYSDLSRQVSVYGVATGYCISASLLSIINKWAIMKFPYPGALTALQYFTSAFGVLLCGQLKLIEHDPITLVTMWRFLPAAIMFYLSLFTNSELLLHSNVDTFIVFRSAVPIFVAIGETLFLKQPWPSLKTWISLATIFGGSLLYVLTDYQFTITAYTWAIAYLVSMSIDLVYIKHVVTTIGLNTWGLVLYNNLEALLLFPLELLIMGEFQKLRHDISDDATDWYTFPVVLPVGLSCLFGLSISFFGFSCRRGISATGFTVLGIMNKLLTVVINLVIWDKHSTFIGTLGLLICMFGGVMYQQSKKPQQQDEQKKLQENKEAT